MPTATRRRFLGYLAWALLLALLVWEAAYVRDLIVTDRIAGDDFIEYWAAGRLNLTGQNPYSAADLLALQQSVGSVYDFPVMMWNPPWTLAFVMPLGLLDYPTARLLWLTLGVAIIFLSADWAYRFYGGPHDRRWLAWLVAAAFLPGVYALRVGQIGPLLLLGLVLFLHFERRQRLWLAGAATVLVAVKPHLLYLVWLALVLWAVDRRRWSVLAGAALSGALALTLALIPNPAVVGQYLTTTANEPPSYWGTPTFGFLLRLIFGLEHYGLQFVPPMLGALWLLSYWRRARHAWQWDRELGGLLLMSLVTTSYGWSFDQVVLIPVLVQAVVWLTVRPQRTPAAHLRRARILALAIFLIVNLGGLAANWLRLTDFLLVWVPPLLLIGYRAVQRASASPSTAPSLMPGALPIFSQAATRDAPRPGSP